MNPIINPIASQINPIGLVAQNTNTINTDDAHSFESFFNAFMGIVNEASALEATSQQLSIDFAIGQTDDMLAVILAQEAAYTAMHFTIQVTSRIIQAYQEIMRMQV